MPDRTKIYDVLVAGGGNAALCAAITARQAGASVLLVESAPRAFRGGNSRHTRNLRAMHDRPNEVLTDEYKEDEYWDDLLRVTGGQTDESLARMTIRASSGVFGWMKAAGVRFQPSLTGTLNLGRTNAFFLGGGKALVNAYYLTAEKLGVEILYDTEVVAINWTTERRARSTSLTKVSRKRFEPVAWWHRPVAFKLIWNGCANTGAMPWTALSSAARPIIEVGY